MHLNRLVACGPAAAAALIAGAGTARARFWGEEGHRIIGRAAAEALPPEMPQFFRDAAAQLTYLNPEPDRWRDNAERRADPALDDAASIEHYIDMEAVPGHALEARDRYTYADSLHAHRLKASATGFLPYRILELAQRLRVEFRLWRGERNPAVRALIEARIINDAGILGHYVGDGSNPHHTTVNHDRWVGKPNPKGYTTVAGFHARFEATYVRTHLALADVQPLIPRDAKTIAPLRDGIRGYLQATFGYLDRLYALDKAEPFGANTQGADHKRFTAERLAAGATMLRDLWWTAWVTSASSGGSGRP